ncbi:uncharacterized protein BYT42DRAFT_558098 [Radiomyces spectabilis]|uniref:uncharacterized protein n=1 Tax=Radiomyces spectabilis TaxID=64574 RepID=UPI00221FF8C2|nr:uncharacterized protein BYT42DRAFT_558098 [Radiomyces spectabilis]KAI8391794.1 hypothetical protein BYT42DRAFT_558098 [Radiomyces spectabilis]
MYSMILLVLPIAGKCQAFKKKRAHNFLAWHRSWKSGFIIPLISAWSMFSSSTLHFLSNVMAIWEKDHWFTALVPNDRSMTIFQSIRMGSSSLLQCCTLYGVDHNHSMGFDRPNSKH